MDVYLGTVNDGTTDNTAYIQTAVNAVAAVPTLWWSP
jgi:polygalacturonase